ncbi:hypothetical protein [Sagittula sp. S175]|uniref:hypothetical protein n=1 Tax=Sagittula sp. S175 TaxID=3415129 RepID=UPI003C7CC738
MPALNFQERFAPDVESGIKRQSMRKPRADGKPHCKVGDTLKLYTGMRTQQCRLLGEARVTRIATVKIDQTGMKLDGERLFACLHSRDQLDPTDNEFAEADGFESFADMRDWIEETHGPLPFEGVVIYWSEPR